MTVRSSLRWEIVNEDIFITLLTLTSHRPLCFLFCFIHTGSKTGWEETLFWSQQAYYSLNDRCFMLVMPFQCSHTETSAELVQGLEDVGTFYASTPSNSGGRGDFGCLLSKCCLKVFGSGIWDCGGDTIQFSSQKVTENIDELHSPFHECIIIHIT